MPSCVTRAVGAALLAGVVALAAAPARADMAEVAFEPAGCPAPLSGVADCHVGRDGNGAWLLVAMPREWNRRLVVHAHGGPRLGGPGRDDPQEDLARYAVLVQAGYAWVGSTYRRGGYGVRVAAEDVDNSRAAFWARWGRPQRTLLHGQSWGGNVAAKAAELHALDMEGEPVFDGVFTTNGLLTGGTRAYGFRADLRAVYQAICNNHPAPGEASYPLWQGLPADVRMTRDALRKRVDACTGIDRPPARRTREQAARLADLVAVSGIAEPHLVAHLAWATFHFRDLVQRHLRGGNPFDNRATVYRGSRDDDALNAAVERFDADPAAVARLAYDADLSGHIVLPMLTVHALGDAVVSADAQLAYADTVRAAGNQHLLAQFGTDESDHSRLRDTTYLAVVAALEAWLDGGGPPDAARLHDACRAHGGAAGDCTFVQR
ncbi:hypothetical protein E2F46_15360 [Luteimonas aestuarii]|uniref:Alpha/beta hydrolase n=1 Tax=Luteimonas aestuarii TaxID=453837 RepID=A0A4R5TJ10_9GAMM|nr:hypothetical protein [Luteimonas aestuarii]TDK21074.1 hypothetical protein E2F46_15360 [Luteimonas aestuarii]